MRPAALCVRCFNAWLRAKPRASRAGPLEAPRGDWDLCQGIWAPERSSKSTGEPVTGTQKSPARKASPGQMAGWTLDKILFPQGKGMSGFQGKLQSNPAPCTCAPESHWDGQGKISTIPAGGLHHKGIPGSAKGLPRTLKWPGMDRRLHMSMETAGSARLA